VHACIGVSFYIGTVRELRPSTVSKGFSEKGISGAATRKRAKQCYNNNRAYSL
jgi:hypothetical protein